MKRFNITVNGKAYDVAVEEVGAGAPVAAAPVAAPAPAPAAAPAAPAAPAPAPAAAPANVEGTKVVAPMPGTILDVKVAVGDTVSEGQPVVVLEAMKMENDIPATVAGKIVSVNVSKGDTINSNDVIVVIQ